MKIIKRILLVLAIGVGVLVLAVVALFGFAAYRSAHYYDFTQTGGPIEAYFTPMGPLDVSHEEFDLDGTGPAKQQIWYPSGIEEDGIKYPLVIIANGTGSQALTEQAVWKHLASWGFIVVGNGDENSRSGASSAASLDFVARLAFDTESMFHDHVDLKNVGITGHSQGGVGAFNAVTKQHNGDQYKALFVASPTGVYWGQESVFGTEWSYDTSKLTIPSFMMAGTGAFDAGTADNIEAKEGQGIIPLWSLQQIYAAIPDGVDKVSARRSDADHGNTLHDSSGYMVAWFKYWLADEKGAGTAFFGNKAEIADNAQWQDVERSR